MKKCTAKLNSIGLGSRLVLAILIAMSLIPLSCERDSVSNNSTPCDTGSLPTTYVKQPGMMFYVADANRWAISFLPTCLEAFDTEYLAFIPDDYPITENLTVQGKKVIFSGAIKPSAYTSEWSKSIAVIELYDLELTLLAEKQQ